MTEKLLMRIRKNGDLETFVDVERGDILSISSSSITLPKIFEYPPEGLENYFSDTKSVSGYISGSSGGSIKISSEYERASDFIDVNGWTETTVTVRFKGMDGTLPAYVAIALYDENKNFLNMAYNSYQPTATGDHMLVRNITLNNNVGYLRISANYYEYDTVDVKINVQKGEVSSKHYISFEDELWVKDTGNIFSLFKDGIVIKGEVKNR